MADEKLVHAHELFLSHIGTVCLDDQADPDILSRCCANLARIIIPANCLQEIEKTLLDLLLNYPAPDAKAEVAWAKVCILREAIKNIQSRQKPKPKPKKKSARAPLSPAQTELAEPLVLAGAKG